MDTLISFPFLCQLGIFLSYSMSDLWKAKLQDIANRNSFKGTIDTTWASIFAAVQLPRNNFSRLIVREPCMSEFFAHPNLTGTVSKKLCSEAKDCLTVAPENTIRVEISQLSSGGT